MARSRRQKNQSRSLVFARKMMTGCEDCGKFDPSDLTMHHIDPKLKTMGISKLVHTGTTRRLKDELLICRVLCSECHKKYHTATGALRIPKED
jgi:hypothetical protein